MPRNATKANSAIDATAITMAITSTGLLPQDWERRPQYWLVSTSMSADTLTIRPICHSAMRTSRASGAMIGLMVCWERKSSRVETRISGTCERAGGPEGPSPEVVTRAHFLRTGRNRTSWAMVATCAPASVPTRPRYRPRPWETVSGCRSMSIHSFMFTGWLNQTAWSRLESERYSSVFQAPTPLEMSER